MRKFLVLLAIAAFGLSSAAMADVTARYVISPPARPAVGGAPAPASSGPPGTFIFSADDHGQARIEAEGGGQSPILIRRDGVGYAVMPSPQGPLVARQADLIAFGASMMAAMRAGGGENPPAGGPAGHMAAMAAARLEVVERGSETVAGVRGTVYAVTIVMGERRQGPFEIVLSTDPNLAPVGVEMLRVVDSLREPLAAMMGAAPPIFAAARELLGRGTPIRIGDAFRLAAVNTDPVPAAQFALPGPVLTAQEMMSRIGLAGMTGRLDAAPAPPATGNAEHDAHGNASNPR
jgi:hypothetical protein